MTDVLHFTDSDEANALLVREPMALLIGFALDQQVTVQKAFSGPLAIRERVGTLDAGALAAMDLEPVFRERPAIHRFPGSMARKVHALVAHVAERYDGDAGRIWRDAGSAQELDERLRALPGYGDMKVASLAAVLARRFGVAVAEPLIPSHPTLGDVLARRFGVAVAEPLIPSHPTLGDVDSPDALAAYQAGKRAQKAAMRAAAASRA